MQKVSRASIWSGARHFRAWRPRGEGESGYNLPVDAKADSMVTMLVTSDAWSSLPPEERFRRERRATYWRESLKHIPWYQRKTEREGDEFWARFYDSGVKT